MTHAASQEPETKPETSSETRPETEPEPETKPETKPEPETRPETEPEPETDRPWLGMGALALVVAVIIAVLGVESAVSSLQRKEYSKDRATTVFFLKNGSAISTSMQRLEEINANDRSLLTGAASAIETRDTRRFMRDMAQGVVNSDEQLRLQKQVMDYQQAFDKVFLR